MGCVGGLAQLVLYGLGEPNEYTNDNEKY